MSHGLTREHLLTALLESPDDGIIGVSLEGTIESWSRGAERLYGYKTQEITGQPLRRLVPLHELPLLEAALSHVGQKDFPGIEICERLRKDGARILLKIKRGALRDEQGEVRGIIENARALNSSGADPAAEGPLRLIIDQMPGLHWTTNQNLQVTSNWGKGLAAFRIPPDAFLGHSVCEFLVCADRHTTPIAEHYDALRGFPSHFEYQWKNRILEIRLEPLRAALGEISGCLGSGVDITDRKKNEEQTFYQARHDALTGLANYREFMDRLEQEVRRAERSHHSFSVLLLDLDGLKRINDLHGHLAGNRALQRLAAVMSEHCRSTDLAVRYGGDEFALVMIDSDKGMAQQVAQRIENGIATDRGKPPVSVSTGIGIYPDDGRTATELIEAADRQLYKSKRAENRPISTSTEQPLSYKRATR
jgi:diguanylate cyclase (GGDEF)-like protein/PAS domain S-box-containing protein